MTKIDDISRTIGRIEEGIKQLNEKFDALPCPAHEAKIQEIIDYKNKALGMITIISLIAGFMGWVLTFIINWVLNELK